MYAAYSYLSSPSQANILADIVAILTGTTNPASLSAACDVANTTILTTYAVAGWTVHDAAAGTNVVCLKALCAHGAIYKYITIDTNTAGYIILRLWQDWNATTHIGTNGTSVTYSAITYSERYNTAGVGMLYIYATVRCVWLFGIYGATTGSSNNADGCAGIFETEAAEWQTVVSGLLPAVYRHAAAVTDTNAVVIGPHKKTDNTTSTTSLVANIMGMAGIMTNTTPTYYKPNSVGSKILMMFDAFVYIGGSGASCVIFGKVAPASDLYFVGNGPTHFDDYTDSDGKTRILFPWSSSLFMAVLKG